jgi:hypothetical protein
MSDALAYTDPARVLDTRSDDTIPRRGQTVSGYGGRIPTRHKIRYRGADGVRRWHRVYVMSYGNAGSAYILADGGRTYFVDASTEARVTS